MALRQQLSVYGQLKVKPRLKTEDRVFWVLFSMGYRSWRTCLKFVQPRTVLRWHAAGFKIFWRKKCEKTGRPRTPKLHQDLIRKMSIDEPGWGTDRIADELRLKLGIRHAASTVQKYMVRPEHRTRTGQTGRTLMKNHKDEIWSCDFLVQHTALFLCSLYLHHYGDFNAEDNRVQRNLQSHTRMGETANSRGHGLRRAAKDLDSRQRRNLRPVR